MKIGSAGGGGDITAGAVSASHHAQKPALTDATGENSEMTAPSHGDPLFGVAAKIGRADYLIEELDGRVNEFLLRLDDEAITSQVGPDHDLHAYRVTMRQPLVPHQIAVLVGDVLHNLRSALDHLARALVVTSGARAVDGSRGTTFPVRDTRREHPARLVPSAWPEIDALVDAVQPYNWPDADRAKHPLLVLHQLNNIDKHRLLHVAVIAGNGRVVFRDRGLHGQPLAVDGKRYFVRMLGDTEQIISVDEPLEPDPEMTGMWLYTVSLHEGPGSWPQGVVGLLRSLRQFTVEDVIRPADEILHKRQVSDGSQKRGS